MYIDRLYQYAKKTYVNILFIFIPIIYSYNILYAKDINDDCRFITNEYFAAHFEIYPANIISSNSICFIKNMCNISPNVGMQTLVYDIIGVANILENKTINISIAYKNRPYQNIYTFSDKPINGVICKKLYLNQGKYITNVEIVINDETEKLLNKYGIFLNSRIIQFKFLFNIKDGYNIEELCYRILEVLSIILVICSFIGYLFIKMYR
ncbi:hypothetical protein [Candidatus Methylacidiphilum infernorum]|uniref:hypothetical protein n=1 Tax=Candidatus Methylacidiphilum infernorum TaxID=511746 RepID=UPI00066256C1|nr:hypothetical protein [Candidatus Methylacidiphilum infernorum]